MFNMNFLSLFSSAFMNLCKEKNYIILEDLKATKYYVFCMFVNNSVLGVIYDWSFIKKGSFENCKVLKKHKYSHNDVIDGNVN